MSGFVGDLDWPLVCLLVCAGSFCCLVVFELCSSAVSEVFVCLFRADLVSVSLKTSFSLLSVFVLLSRSGVIECRRVFLSGVIDCRLVFLSGVIDCLRVLISGDMASSRDFLVMICSSDRI